MPGKIHNKNPLVSVVIPTADRPMLLERAIKSVLAQSFQDYEILIIDDGKQAEAKSVAQKISDDRLVYFQNLQPGLGGSATRNVGIRNARGKYIAFLDDDDEWFPEKLESQLKVFDEYGEQIGFVVTAVEKTDDHISVAIPLPVRGKGNFHEIALIRFKTFVTSTWVVRREVLEKAGYFDENFPSHQDAEFMIRITEISDGYAIDRPLTRMDIGSGYEHVGSKLSRRIRGRELLLEKHKSKYLKRPKVHAKILFRLGLWYKELGDKKRSSYYFTEAYRTHRTMRFFAHSLVSRLRCMLG